MCSGRLAGIRRRLTAGGWGARKEEVAETQDHEREADSEKDCRAPEKEFTTGGTRQPEVPQAQRNADQGTREGQRHRDQRSSKGALPEPPVSLLAREAMRAP